MVSNLIDNSIKYTKPNSSVDIKLDKNTNFIKIIISDEGHGIPKESQYRIFDRFYRCDISRSKEGSGLGLSYARAVARSHGGDIILETSSKKGSTFVVLLPI
jgi:signal transduction histidine kinase